MVLERLYVIPHGDEILDRPNENSKRMYSAISQMVLGDSSELIALVSPHSLILPERVAIINTENAGGIYHIKSGELSVNCKIDRLLSRQLQIMAGDAADLVGFVTSNGPMSNFPLDFGSIIPLTFFNQRRLVLMGQPRPKNPDRMYAFGKILYDWSREEKRKISIVFSADQAHTHSPDGPYGYSDESSIYDSEIISAIDKSDFSKIRSFDQEFIGKAKPDSFWNMIMLAGLLDASNMKMKVNYYYVEHYFGMLAAGLMW